MSVKIAGRKSKLNRIGLILSLILLLSSIALPAGASPPQYLKFTLDTTYADIPTLYGSGTWSVEGLIDGSGTVEETYHSSGWDGCWRTVHTTTLLTGPTPEDTITIRSQVVRVGAAPGCDPFVASVNWVILSATGIYAGLHGQGQSEEMISGGLQVNQGGGLDLIVHSELEGQGHFR